MNLGYALSQGAAGAAQGVGVLADTQLKANADQVALNQKLDFNTREKAAEIMLNQRAAEYRMNQVKGYAAPVTTTTPGSPATPGVLANPDDAAYSELDGAAGPVADTPATAATPDTTSTRASTNTERANRAAEAGDMGAFKQYDDAGHQDARIQDLTNRLIYGERRAVIGAAGKTDSATIRAKAMTDVATTKAQSVSDAIWDKSHDDNGKFIPPPGPAMAELYTASKGLEGDLRRNESEIHQAQAAINALNAGIANGTIPYKKPEQKASVDQQIAAQTALIEKARSENLGTLQTRTQMHQRFPNLTQPQGGVLNTPYPPSQARPDEQADVPDGSVSPAAAAARFLDKRK